MFDLREGPCLPKVLVGVNVGLALVDAIIAAVAFSQVCFFFFFFVLFFSWLKCSAWCGFAFCELGFGRSLFPVLHCGKDANVGGKVGDLKWGS